MTVPLEREVTLVCQACDHRWRGCAADADCPQCGEALDSIFSQVCREGDVLAPARSGDEAAILGALNAMLPPMKLPPGRYKGLTLRQPWAWCVVYGSKDVENRSWWASYRGPIVIHAGKEMTRKEYRRGADYAESLGLQIPPPEKLQFGGIIGRAVVTDIVPPLSEGAVPRPWHLPEYYGWVLAERQPVELVPCKGGLSLSWFEVP